MRSSRWDRNPKPIFHYFQSWYSILLQDVRALASPCGGQPQHKLRLGTWGIIVHHCFYEWLLASNFIEQKVRYLAQLLGNDGHDLLGKLVDCTPVVIEHISARE